MGRITTKFLLGILCLFLIGVTGCDSGGGSGGDDGGGSEEEPLTVVEAFSEARAISDEADCSCRTSRGLFEEVDECFTLTAPEPDATEACLQEVVDATFSAEENLECATALEEALGNCLNASGCSEVEYNGCFDAYKFVYPFCPAFNPEVIEELNDCF